MQRQITNGNKMPDPKTKQITARLTEKAYSNVQAVAKKGKWSDGFAVNEMLEGAAAPKTETPRKAKTAKTNWPEGFVLTADRFDAAHTHWSAKKRDDLSATEEWGKFYDHWLKAGRKYVDWNAAWRTWYTNAVQFNKPPNGGGQNGKARICDAERFANQAQRAGLSTSSKQRKDSGTLLDQDGTVIPE